MLKIIEEARQNSKRYCDFFRSYRKVARDDMDFVNGDQYTDAEKVKRFGRPMEIINDAKIIKRHTIEDYDQKRSQIKVKSYKGGEDKLLAEAFQGAIYHIENESMGEAIKDHAMDDMLSCGMGFYSWETGFVNDLSFDQKICLKPIYDPFNVFLDIMNTASIDNSDCMWGGEVIYFDDKKFEEEWPSAEKRGFPNLDDNVNESHHGKIGVCRYYKIETKNDTVISILNPFTGKIITIYVSDFEKQEYNPLLAYYKQQGYKDSQDIFAWLNKTKRILADRDVERKTVKWYLLSYNEILDQGEIGGEFVPIIPMLGPRYVMSGDVYFDSQIRQYKDPARLSNYVMSSYVESMAADPIAPYITDMRKIKNYMDIWANANNNPTPFLPFDPVEAPDGTLDATPPMKQPKGDPPAGWATLFQFTEQTKEKTSGLPNSAMGMQGNEVSGSAIDSRANQGLASRSIFFKKRHFSDQLLGKQYEKAIPVYYDAPRNIEIAESSGKSQVARINDKRHDQGEGKYKGQFLDFKNAELVTYITVGPSYGSQRQETTDKLLSILPLAPERYRDVIFPRFLKNVDMIESEELYEDSMKVAPVEIQEQEEVDEKQLQTEKAQLEQQVQELTQVNEELNKVLMGEQQKVQSQERIAQLKAQSDIRKEQIKQQGETQREGMSNRTDIKEAEIDAQAKINAEIIKMMQKLDAKIDNITTITAKGEV